uniref:DNA-directed DNA polymerase n=1 Tax=viral metagenome TaxID=1070528 RepID=A0A6C0E141_9ZZZZ
MERVFRLFDFNVYNDKGNEHSDEDEGPHKDTNSFMIQMFGINDQGVSVSIVVEDYKPFFYVKVDDTWNKSLKMSFLNHLKSKIGKYYQDSIVECKLIERKKLYGFDGGRLHKFILLKFSNINAFNKTKNFWYTNETNDDGENERKLIPRGYKFGETYTELYEANIPPLLRFFHIQEISPSGWVALPNTKTIELTGVNKTTSCAREFIINYKHIIPLNDKEQRVPYKIMSFDIEASSSHGDFPVPVKSYKKLATNIADHFDKLTINNLTPESCKDILRQITQSAFGFHPMNDIDLVYPKEKITSLKELEERLQKWFKTKVRDYTSNSYNEHSIEAMFENIQKEFAKKNESEENGDGDEDEDSDNENGEGINENVKENSGYKPIHQAARSDPYKNKQSTILDIMCDPKLDRQGKINELIMSLRSCFPPLEGDKVTFIGSTFLTYGETDPYLNHCIVLDTCDAMSVQASQIETYSTEKDVLLAWRNLVQRENPDIIIGYNIFSFDYEFMFRRSQECDCMEEFLKLSRNKDEICATKNYKTGLYEIDKSSITLASGTYDLSIIKMTGRMQIDMYNWFRRTENLSSYKLDYVGGYFIGDEVKSLDLLENSEKLLVTKVKTTNLTGLQQQSYIHFEEINHSSDYYKDGQKFKVLEVNKAEKWFTILGHETPKAKKVKWGLAKDDVTPKDIFRMTNEGPSSRSVIAKYCIQDCNLVHYLMNKVDVMTDLIEMSKLCSVPMSFLVFRGQGIKLTSYVAKKCREKRTLMPVINKGSKDDGYEGAIVLEPKCGLYLDKPIAVGDFASLYPSSMLSENLCPSSKVWTKIYDLRNQLVEETGERDLSGSYIYDNLPEYEYVDITFDTFRYVRKNPKARAEKIKSGYKVCRFAQFKEGRAIMPSILEELLGARKSTRKQIPLQKDEFMKNVLDKRQIAYKLTANSLYGQLGAKTSTFYEPDIAASTTSTGRLLLTYAKKVVEECYKDTVVETKIGPVVTKSEYIYGDTDSVFFTFNLQNKDTFEPIVGTIALELSIEIAQEACHMVSSFLKAPHDFEYEKTFMPFCLLSKKRYVGILYEHDPSKGKRKEMGIVLKRRDNAPIVKDVYGGIIDILMKEQNIQKAIDFLKGCLQELVDGTVPIEKLIITKSLRSFYKKPQQIAHKVLADRIATRDPGNKPTSGDRIPFVYIVNNNKKALQGEKIETPTYIKENHIQIDYSFYITNQIMKPLLQLFGLVIEDIWKMQNKTSKIIKFRREIETVKHTIEDPKKAEEKITKLKDKEVKALLFDKYLRDTNNSKEGNQSLIKFFRK